MVGFCTGEHEKLLNILASMNERKFDRKRYEQSQEQNYLIRLNVKLNGTIILKNNFIQKEPWKLYFQNEQNKKIEKKETLK